ncbi:two-partner secretion domain-containing protein [Brenneria goodwinii]|uniref:two-partner secretion domain-containing protein n=1 Tax=Brenneria goodwinii TaxID=1109412 RepID=UPI000EF19CD7|nr:DUF637 domain-containing protein [Brenneria goodwinii]RLM21623.1 hemagglutinin [Brenneria goodwinii]
MEKFNNRATRGLSYLLIYLTAMQPLHPAFAALTPDNPRTQVKNAGNVPVVNIAAPNAAGISHNTYKDFSVGTPGAVLNNGTAAGKSQLAGQLGANANLKGKAAGLIINEVTGSARSDLQGKLEVFGNKANVLIANPNGITCDGCGFINTPAVTLTTGKPQLDQQGMLDALEIKKGGITIGGKGLDGGGANYVDILSRAAELNGKINAKNLSLTQGSNRVNLKTGVISPINGEGAKPQLAVDSKALGGMYAERIRLIATEEGVGANLANLTSTQQDITLSAKGKIQLGNTSAKTDLNLDARETNIAAGINLRSGRDMTLSSATLNNNGSIVSNGDMRIFGDTVRNVGNKAVMHTNKNMWIQKDAAGNKSSKVENRSGTIKTNFGDLVIRTGQLENVRDSLIIQNKDIAPDSTSINPYIGAIMRFHPQLMLMMPYSLKATFGDKLPKKWFGHVDLAKSNNILSGKKITSITSETKMPEIISGKNLYINAGTLQNASGKINASNNIFMTGNILKNTSPNLAELDTYTSVKLAQQIPVNIISNIDNLGRYPSMSINYSYDGISISENIKDKKPGIISAGNNLVADFADSVTLDTPVPFDEKSINQLIAGTIQADALTAKNILLHAKNINSKDAINATEDLTLIAEENINLNRGTLKSGNTLSLLTANTIDARQSNFAGKDISLISREGNVSIYSDNTIRHYATDGTRQFSTLNAAGSLSLQAGKDLTLNGINIGKNQNTVLLTGNNLTIKNDDAYLGQQRPDVTLTSAEKQKAFNDTLGMLGRVNSTGSITLNAGKALDIAGIALNAGKDVSLTAGTDINLNPRTFSAIPESLFVNSRQAELSSNIRAGNQLVISSGKDIQARSANLSANGSTTLLAGNSLQFPATPYSAIDSKNDNNKDDRNVIATVHAGKDLTLAANGELIANGTNFSSGGNMTLSSGGKMEFNAVKNHIYREGNREYSESVSQQSAVLNSGGILTLISNGSMLFQASKLIAKSTLDAAAKGGFLYAQAMEEASHYEKTTTKRKWYGKKTTIRQTSHNVTNKVAEFTAGGDINLLSRDDSTYEASKINAGKNAKLTSTKGKVNFKAVKNTTFEQTITTSKGFFIKNADKGYSKDTWLLPKIYTGGKLTVDAATGITADVKASNSRSLQNALLTFGNTPGTQWLKGLNARKDVQWNAVQDAYSNWNQKSQSLNPVVGAVIAIAVAAVTAGSGLAAMAANGAVTATGAAGMTATVIQGAAYSGMTALTSQAAVALVDNKGNLSKTLQTLGGSDSVKSLVTSMVIGGTLSGFDSVMGWDKTAHGATPLDPAKAKLPMLSNGDWSKVAQRVAGQSVINSSVGTTINGGSFKDNFTNALLANVGNQINAEGVGLIHQSGYVQNTVSKALSYASVSALAAEIGKGDVKGAAAGALAAELATAVMGDTFTDPDTRYARIQNSAKYIGGLAGAIATNKAAGANSGANAGEIVVVNNYLSDSQKAQRNKEFDNCKGDLKCKVQIGVNWDAIDITQESAYGVGILAGVSSGLIDSVRSLLALGLNPNETLGALKSLFNNGDVLGNVTSAVKQSYIDRINKMENEYQKAGPFGAFNSGVEGGKLVGDIAGLVAGGAGIAKGGALLTEKIVAKTTGMVETALKSSVVNKILEADRIGSGLKPDPTHRGASYLSREQLMDGKVFTIKGGDGIERKLLQAEGSFNDKKGIFEYIYDNKGNVTHQRFIESGSITGIPNQRPPKVK